MTQQLRILFQDYPIGWLEQDDRKGLSLRYDETLLASFAGAPVLSIALPVREEPYRGDGLLAFLNGLLPEETIRERLCRQFRLDLGDAFGLLRAIGGDCAGAISFVEPKDLAAWLDNQGIDWLDDDALYDLIDELPLRPLAENPGGGIRISLAGAQNKLAVVVGDDGRIGLPKGRTPSTHIIKPPSTVTTGSGRPAFPWLMQNEAFCLRLAQHAGFDTAECSIRRVKELDLLLVRRYDRTATADGRRVRLHQEDLCQALGVGPTSKYEHDGGPGLADGVRILRRVSIEGSDPLQLLERAAFHLLIGNNDAHGKNIALLHTPVGIRLAPLYDVVSTVVYNRLSRNLAMAIGGHWQWDQVTARHWWQQMEACQLSTVAALRRLAAVADRVLAAWETTWAEAQENGFTFPLLPRVKECMDRQAPSLRALPTFVPRGRRRRRE
ncbi:MAG: type II toxin-antitoxin system HipA family toxin [Chloroflexi bacterium]|nr:type II toxin-antitoxin system HipA family toxin [Chloroflexota bacterium]